MNNNISKIHLDILDNPRKELLDRIIPLIEGFTLGGGTALALQLNHRKSFDFDFFSQSAIPKNFINKISRLISIENITVDTNDELTFFTKDTIKLTFLYYPFTPNYKNIHIESGLTIFSIKEIALQKAYTIGRRGEYRDYFDLYTILKGNYITLKELIQGAKSVYKSVFDEKMFFEQLVYFGDLTNFDITPATEESIPTSDEVKHFFEQVVESCI